MYNVYTNFCYRFSLKHLKHLTNLNLFLYTSNYNINIKHTAIIDTLILHKLYFKALRYTF